MPEPVRYTLIAAWLDALDVTARFRGFDLNDDPVEALEFTVPFASMVSVAAHFRRLATILEDAYWQKVEIPGSTQSEIGG